MGVLMTESSQTPSVVHAVASGSGVTGSRRKGRLVTADEPSDGFPRFDVEGRTALVTGAARGIGRTIALALAHAGADVALGLRNVADAEDLEAEIVGMGRRSIRVGMDVRELGQISAAVDDVVATFGRLDILVNNAGLGTGEQGRGRHRGRLRPDLRRQREGHLLRQPGGRQGDVQPGLRADHQPQLAGRVCRPADRVGVLRDKGGDQPPDEVPRRRMGLHGITVNAVAPTFIRTPGTEPDLADPAFHADVVERIAGLHRIGEPMTSPEPSSSSPRRPPT